MRILDLDLDFFIDNIEYLCDTNERLDDGEFHAWTEIDVRRFLEINCGLSKSKPIPGRVVTHHDEAFQYWRELILSGKLILPFEVVHVDAHADLGLGDPGYRYLLCDILHREIELRSNPEMGVKRCGSGNYLSFAVACRWLSRLEYVTHPKWQDDLPRLHFKEWKTESGFIQLKKFDYSQFSHDFALLYLDRLQPLEMEPEVPFIQTPSSRFIDAGKFDRVVLAQSPGFTPASADRLIPIIAEYMRLE